MKLFNFFFTAIYIDPFYILVFSSRDSLRESMLH